MFSRNRRGRRQASTDAPVDTALAAETLCRWAESQPWVVAPAGAGSPFPGRSFVIDCADLGPRTPWCGIGPDDDTAASGSEVFVVLPSAIAGKCVSVRWAVAIATLPGDRSVISIALPETVTELQALEGLLQVAYCAAFRRVGPLV